MGSMFLDKEDFLMLDQKRITGLFYLQRENQYYEFYHTGKSIFIEKSTKTSPMDFVYDKNYPNWLTRHSLGVKGELEDYTILQNSTNKTKSTENLRHLEESIAVQNQKIKNLDYNGIKITVEPIGYSHSVGPIHAGIIEPGHFRFNVNGEIIQNLNIRLGYQRRDILSKLVGMNPIQATVLSTMISGDSTIAYSTAFSQVYEQALNVQIPIMTQLVRQILLELERVATHVGDMGAIAGDVGYYPLQGVCATDRGIALGAMETLTGSRFGKGAIYPTDIVLQKNLSPNKISAIIQNLDKLYKSIQLHFQDAIHSSTFRERLQGCGRITKSMVFENSFTGMTARCTGAIDDLRLLLTHKNYPNCNLDINTEQDNLQGDAWSRLCLRFIEFKNSVEWLMAILKEIDFEQFNVQRELHKIVERSFHSGLYYSAIESWRGSVLIALDINKDGLIQQAYIRDPSVLNWHALELAVVNELIGDFPLNNKSFNLSYVGVDL